MKKTSLAMRTKNEFLDLLQKGLFLPGEKLPTESQMAHQFNISRETWRNCLELLRRDGIVYSKHGAGTYILNSSTKIRNDLSELRSLSDMISQAGIKELNSEVCVYKSHIPQEFKAALLVDDDTDIFTIKRTRFSETGIICSSLNYIPNELSDNIDLDNPPLSIFKYFEDEKEIYVSRSSTNIVVPDIYDPIVKEIQKNDNCPVLLLKQLHFDSRGNVVMYSLDYLRCDLFNFFITRIRH